MLTKTDLFELLSVKNKDFQIYDHDPLFTVEDSENLRGEIKGAHTKLSLIHISEPTRPY